MGDRIAYLSRKNPTSRARRARVGAAAAAAAAETPGAAAARAASRNHRPNTPPVCLLWAIASRTLAAKTLPLEPAELGSGRRRRRRRRRPQERPLRGQLRGTTGLTP